MLTNLIFKQRELKEELSRIEQEIESHKCINDLDTKGYYISRKATTNENVAKLCFPVNCDIISQFGNVRYDNWIDIVVHDQQHCNYTQYILKNFEHDYKNDLPTISEIGELDDNDDEYDDDVADLSTDISLNANGRGKKTICYYFHWIPRELPPGTMKDIIYDYADKADIHRKCERVGDVIITHDLTGYEERKTSAHYEVYCDMNNINYEDLPDSEKAMLDDLDFMYICFANDSHDYFILP